MTQKLLKQYLMSDCLSRNITLNSQLSYWKGQKKWIETAPTGEEYLHYRQFTLNKFNPFSCFAKWLFKSRKGLNMKWENRRRTIWGWGLHTDRLNSPPIKYIFSNKICVLQRKFKYYIQLCKGTREWTTLIRIRSEFGCAKC